MQDSSSWRGTTRQRSPIHFDGETSSEPLQFGSEPSLTKVSLFGGDPSFNMITDEPSFHPSNSPLPLEIPDSISYNDLILQQDNDDDEEEQKTPLPDKNTQQQLLEAQQHQLQKPTTTTQSLLNDHSSVFDQESRLELQFELLSMADANIHSSTDNNTSMSQHNKHSSRNDNNDNNENDLYQHGIVTNGNNNSNNNTAEAQKERSATLTLKEQEKVNEKVYYSLSSWSSL